MAKSIRQKIKEEAMYIQDLEKEIKKVRISLHKLLNEARKDKIGPTELAAETNHLYTKEHISRIAPAPKDL